MPESNTPEGAFGVPLVTVCGTPLVSLFFHITKVPTRTVIDCESNIMLWIETFAVPAIGVGVG